METTIWNLRLGQIIPQPKSFLQEKSHYLIGVLPGEGIGPEVIDASLAVLKAAADRMPVRVEIRFGGEIGWPAFRETGRALTPQVIQFCESVFEQGGAVLCGPGGNRFVYELRARFNLFCKISPIRPLPSMFEAGVIKPEAKKDVDILMVRENSSGAYFGRWDQQETETGKIASHAVDYREEEVARIIRVAIGLAQHRRRRLALVLKSEGLPSISALWTHVAERLVKDSDVSLQVLQVDNAAFQLVQAAKNFDVVVSSNLLGDILADFAGVLLGSRGLCFSGNFGMAGEAVYQTGHGAAYDLRGRNVANPIAQILSLVMLLQVSFGLSGMAAGILKALDEALQAGWRTPDIAGPGARLVGTRELGQRIIDAMERCLDEAR